MMHEMTTVDAPAVAIEGVSHCDRNLFSGDASELYRYWKGGAGRV